MRAVPVSRKRICQQSWCLHTTPFANTQTYIRNDLTVLIRTLTSEANRQCVKSGKQFISADHVEEALEVTISGMQCASPSSLLRDEHHHDPRMRL